MSEAYSEAIEALLSLEDARVFVAGLSDGEIHGYYRQVIAQLARQNDNAFGYACFYQVIFGRPLPSHAREWIEAIYKNREAGKGTAVIAFRGSTKTTSVTIGFAAFRIGHEPQRANLLIQVGDDIAVDNTSQVADIIRNNPGWKLVFPHVVPDELKGWGAGGYEVKRDDMPYEAWREQNAARKDPTLIGVGYRSHDIIGKHPDGVLIVDDIHDEINTASELELNKTLKILTGTIFPTETETTWSVFIGTPWNKRDTLAYIEATGEYGVTRTPVFEVVVEGIEAAIEFENQWVSLAWAEKFPIEEIRRVKRKAGLVEFARMYLLDLAMTSNMVFKRHSYPHERINTGLWVGGGGADYAAIHEMFIDREGKRDFFALAYGFIIPGGGLVIFDGVNEHVSQAQAESYVERAQNMFPNWRGCAVEGDGRGEDFIAMLYRKPNLRVVPFKTGGKGKEARLVRQLGPWLESGRIRVSDAETPFLNALRQQLDDYPNVEHDDALDAVYWLARLFPDVLALPDVEEELPPLERRKRQPNPFASLTKV